MTEQLHQRLADLAGDAGTPAPVDPGALWRTGKRRQRRRTAAVGLAVVALCGGLGSVGLALPGTGWTSTVHPATEVHGPHLPDRIYEVSPWLPTTAEKGPIGPLALVIGGREERDLVGGAEPGYVGVSAETGEYRFLSLPDLRIDPELGWGDEVALSADGTKLAYWYGGDTDGLEGGVTLSGDGIAVYDTVSGEVRKRPIASPHGIQAEPPLWVGNRLWLSWFENVADDPNSGVNGRTMSWEPVSDEMVRVPDDVMMPGAAAVSGDRVVVEAEGGVRIVDELGLNAWRLDVLGSHEGPLLRSVDGARVASRKDPDGDPSTMTNEPAPILVGDVPTTALLRHAQTVTACKVCPRVRLTEVPDSVDLTPLTWRNEEQLVVTADGTGRGDADGWAYESFNPDTGDRHRLVTVPSGFGSGNLHVAADAWSWPSADAERPDAPRDPRALLAGGLTLLLAVGGAALVLWGRRVRG